MNHRTDGGSPQAISTGIVNWYLMANDIVFTLTIIFSLITGTGAGLLALLTWEILRRSPFGRAVAALSLAMGIFVVYHVLLILLPSELLITKVFKSAMFTGVAIFIGMIIRSQHRMRSGMNIPDNTTGNT